MITAWHVVSVQGTWHPFVVRPKRLVACTDWVAEFVASSTTWFEMTAPPGTPGFWIAPAEMESTSFADFTFNSTAPSDLQGTSGVM